MATQISVFLKKKLNIIVVGVDDVCTCELGRGDASTKMRAMCFLRTRVKYTYGQLCNFIDRLCRIQLLVIVSQSSSSLLRVEGGDTDKC